ncbi:Protein of unknown function, partial [Gryllus bimaculatus]
PLEAFSSGLAALRGRQREGGGEGDDCGDGGGEICTILSDVLLITKIIRAYGGSGLTMFKEKKFYVEHVSVVRYSRINKLKNDFKFDSIGFTFVNNIKNVTYG